MAFRPTPGADPLAVAAMLGPGPLYRTPNAKRDESPRTKAEETPLGADAEAKAETAAIAATAATAHSIGLKLDGSAGSKFREAAAAVAGKTRKHSSMESASTSAGGGTAATSEFVETSNPCILFRRLPSHWRANRAFEHSFQIRVTNNSVIDSAEVVLSAGIGEARDVRMKNNKAVFHNGLATFKDLRFMNTCGTGGKWRDVTDASSLLSPPPPFLIVFFFRTRV